MKANNIFMMLAIVALVFAAINASIVLIKTPSFKKITGYASSGYVNVTVDTQITINMTTDTVNWGAGTIDPGQDNATLKTNNGGTASVTGGNWSDEPGPTALVVANIGSVNASLTLKTEKNATTFFAGGTLNSEYMWNITNKDAGSCNGGTEVLNAWRNVNKTVAGKFCSQFGFFPANEIYINLLLTIPKDTTSTGLQSDTITVTASTATS